jgi:hypothetical protein
VAFTVLLNLGAGAVGARMSGWDGSLQRVQEALLVLPAPFTTGATAAWLVQDHRWSLLRSEASIRVADAAVMGGAWLFSSLLIQMIWARIDVGSEPRGMPVADVLLYSLCFGGALGAMVPHLVRPDRHALTSRPYVVAPTPASPALRDPAPAGLGGAVRSPVALVD